MFEKEYVFKGKHAEIVNKLTSKFDQNNSIFFTNYDVYLIAPIVGFLYGRKADFDNGKENTKIFPDKLMKEKNNLIFNFRLILLLDKENEPVLEERINKAFRYSDIEKLKKEQILYENYVLGGLEVLEEKLLHNIRNTEDYFKNLYDFIEEFEERYNGSLETNNLLDLCKLATSY